MPVPPAGSTRDVRVSSPIPTTRVTLVLDGRPTSELPEGVHDDVAVVYARRGGRDAADDRIVELVAADPDPGGLTVVTSDRELARRVRELGADVIGAGELLRRLDACDDDLLGTLSRLLPLATSLNVPKTAWPYHRRDAPRRLSVSSRRSLAACSSGFGAPRSRRRRRRRSDRGMTTAAALRGRRSRVLPLVDSVAVDAGGSATATVPAAGAPTRALPTTIYYPAEGRPPAAPSTDGPTSRKPTRRPRRATSPSIFFSHGSPGSPHDYAATLERWAAEGYAVVAPTYPVTSRAGITEVVAARPAEPGA